VVAVVQYTPAHLEQEVVVVTVLVLVVHVTRDDLRTVANQDVDYVFEEVYDIPLTIKRRISQEDGVLLQPHRLVLEDLTEPQLLLDDDLMVRELVVDVDPIDEEYDFGFELREPPGLLEVAVGWREVVGAEQQFDEVAQAEQVLEFGAIEFEALLAQCGLEQDVDEFGVV
jgi:hypothetical protein